MAKHNKICAHCGGDNVRVDAWASWDADAQDWVLHAVFDAAYCDDCENACDVDEVEIETPKLTDLGSFDEAKGCLPIPEEKPSIVYVSSDADGGSDWIKNALSMDKDKG